MGKGCISWGVPWRRFACRSAVADPHRRLSLGPSRSGRSNLDRLQIVKLWLEKGQYVERSMRWRFRTDQNRSKDGKAPVVGNTVDLQKATYTNTIGR